VPAAELGPAAEDVRKNGFLPLTSVSGITENDEISKLLDQTEKRFKHKGGLVLSDPPLMSTEVLQAVNTTEDGEKSGAAISSSAPSEKRTGTGSAVVYKPIYHSSARQPHEVIRNRRALREGIDR